MCISVQLSLHSSWKVILTTLKIDLSHIYIQYVMHLHVQMMYTHLHVTPFQSRLVLRANFCLPAKN